MNTLIPYIKSSIGKKQIVAVTGLLLILFVVGHLAGNLLIYLGPEAFNKYADKLKHLRPGLYLVEVGLLIIFIIHMWLTAVIVIENYQARGTRYSVSQAVGKRSLATRLMPYTGTTVIVFVIWHLLDFTFVDHSGPLSVLADGLSYGLYGVVYNAFSDPLHSMFYVIAMFALGLHLSHGIQSFAQTFGFNHPNYTPVVKTVSGGLGFFIAVAFSSIPVYILLQ